MGVKVYYSEISAHKEVKKRQQKVMMILESKSIPYEAIDITEPGKENEKDFMLTNAKAKADVKTVGCPQVFNDETYCGDYEDFELANENDELEKFLNVEKIVNNKPAINGNQNTVNGNRESSAEKEENVEQSNVSEDAATAASEDNPPAEEEEEAEPMSTTEPAPASTTVNPPADEPGLEEVEQDAGAEEEEEDE